MRYSFQRVVYNGRPAWIAEVRSQSGLFMGRVVGSSKVKCMEKAKELFCN